MSEIKLFEVGTVVKAHLFHGSIGETTANNDRAEHGDIFRRSFSEK